MKPSNSNCASDLDIVQHKTDFLVIQPRFRVKSNVISTEDVKKVAKENKQKPSLCTHNTQSRHTTPKVDGRKNSIEKSFY